MAEAKDRNIAQLPKPYMKDAAPRQALNFHVKTEEACSCGNTGNISLKVLKAILVGDVAVGKSCLVNRYCRNFFDRDYKATIGVDFQVERFQILDHECNLQIWDTAGQERFKCMATAYYRGSHVIIAVFDLTDHMSLQNTRKWVQEALHQNNSTCPEIFLVGSKLDLCTEKDLNKMEQEAIQIANDLNAEYWAVSSKTGKNVKEFFRRMAAIMFEQAILRELENNKKRQDTTQIGSDVLRIGERPAKDELKPGTSKRCCAGGRSR